MRPARGRSRTAAPAAGSETAPAPRRRCSAASLNNWRAKARRGSRSRQARTSAGHGFLCAQLGVLVEQGEDAAGGGGQRALGGHPLRGRARRPPGARPGATVACVLRRCAASRASSAPCSAASGSRSAATSGATVAPRWRCASSTLAQADADGVAQRDQPVVGAEHPEHQHRCHHQGGDLLRAQAPVSAGLRSARALRPGRAPPTSARSGPPARPARGRGTCRC